MQKYPYYLLLSLFLAKVFYVCTESLYNHYVLTITTSSDVSRLTIEMLNINGHKIAAIGFMLFLFPLIYLAWQKLFRGACYLLLAVMLFFTYQGSYKTLDYAVEKIVEVYHDNRHDAFYLNVAKFGILNNIYAYPSLVGSESIASKSLSTDDKIAMLSIFLLLDLDKDIIQKIKTRGQEEIAALYVDQNVNGDFSMQFEEFKSAAKDISQIWDILNRERSTLKKRIDTLYRANHSNKERDILEEKLLSEYKKRIEYMLGENELPLSIKWDGFIQSQYIKSKIENYLGVVEVEDIENVRRVLLSKDLGNFRRYIYQPKIEQVMSDMKYDESDFLDGAVAEVDGDEALKLLYIPPFALALSLIGILLNLVTVIVLAAYILGLPKKLILVIQVALIALLLVLPFRQEPAILKHKITSQLTATQVNFLRVIHYYVDINSQLHDDTLLAKDFKNLMQEPILEW